MNALDQDRWEIGAELVQTEARLIDDGAWQDWMSLYTKDCVFWIPTWRSDGTLTSNPMREVSHIYMVGRGSLEDRVLRVGSVNAAASIPMQRTTHMLSPPALLSRDNNDNLEIQTSFTSHVFFPRTHDTSVFFGTYYHSIRKIESEWRISAKKIVLKNDYIPTMIDFYSI